jgi:PAS domain S-box-containing protein
MQQHRCSDTIVSHARLFDTEEQAVIGTTVEGTIVYWNSAAAKLYLWAEEEVVGRNVLDVTPSTIARETASEIMARLSAGRSWTGEFPVRRRDGSEFFARVSNVPVRAPDGGLVGIVGISAPRAG